MRLRVKDNQIVDLAHPDIENWLTLTDTVSLGDPLLENPSILFNNVSSSITTLKYPITLNNPYYTISMHIAIDTIDSNKPIFGVRNQVSSRNTQSIFFYFDKSNSYILLPTYVNMVNNINLARCNPNIKLPTDKIHLAVTADLSSEGSASSTAIFLNGHMIGSGKYGYYQTNIRNPIITIQGFKGTIDDVCLINDILWTEDFTPPTTYLPDKI